MSSDNSYLEKKPIFTALQDRVYSWFLHNPNKSCTDCEYGLGVKHQSVSAAITSLKQEGALLKVGVKIKPDNNFKESLYIPVPDLKARVKLPKKSLVDTSKINKVLHLTHVLQGTPNLEREDFIRQLENIRGAIIDLGLSK